MVIRKLKEYLVRNANWVLGGLLGINLFIRLSILFETTLFRFSDFRVYLNAVDRIYEQGSIPLISTNALFFNSYIGYFFKYILGDIGYYFILNCLLGTLTSLVIYLICLKLTKNKLVGLVAVFIHGIYLEFMVFSSIFYTTIIMVFILSLIMLLLIYYVGANGYKRVLIISAILFLVNFSYFFKGELSKLWILLILFGLINFKKKQILFGFVLLGILLTLSTQILRYSHILPYKEGNISHNNFIFYGHTLYGGDGGDGAFIYKENEERYNKALAEYCKKNNITTLTGIDKNNFQRQEIIKFITKHPFKWVKLQFYKFFRFFGVVPETNSYKVLATGILRNQLIFTAVALVFPFALMILFLIIAFDFTLIRDRINRPELILLGLLVLYYIAGSVFYGQYQERYRIPILVCLLIPYLSWSLIKFNFMELIKNKKVLFFKLGIVALLLVIWISQTYSALVINKGRYMIVIDKITAKK